MVYESDIDLKEIVYLITDNEQSPRLVTSIMFIADGGIIYGLNVLEYVSKHYRCEISKKKDQLKSLGIHE